MGATGAYTTGACTTGAYTTGACTTGAYTTLESRYDARLAEFAAERGRLPDLVADLDRTRAAAADATEDYARRELLAAADALHTRIARIRNRDDETEYILATAPFIREHDAKAEVDPDAPSTLGGFVTVTAKSQKSNVLRRYLAHVENDAQHLDGYIVGGHRNAIDTVCVGCDANMVYVARESMMVCRECGLTAEYMEMTDANMSYDQEVNQDVVNYFAYKRLNHFIEWLNSLQAKENTEIPEHVIVAVKAEFKKARATTRADITIKRVREFLKKLKMNKFYEHTHHIVNMLNGVPPPRLTDELEATLKHMFAQIQDPFDKHCPPTRRNFLSYSYVLFKFCELLGHDELLPYFPLLKSSEKLYQQDQIWKKICGELDWQYIASV
jgi:hypothetical protein